MEIYKFFLAFILFILGAFLGNFLAFVSRQLPPILLNDEEPRTLFSKYYRYGLRLNEFQLYRIISIVPSFFCSSKKTHGISFLKSLSFRTLFFEFLFAIVLTMFILLFSPGVKIFFLLLLFPFCVLSFFSDYDYGILPDQYTLSILWIGLVFSCFGVVVNSQEAILGAVVGYGVFWIFNCVFILFKGTDGMYPGDFKLNAGIGACLGLYYLFNVVGIAFVLLICTTLVQSMIKKGGVNKSLLKKEIPYGCYASLALIFNLFLVLLEL